MKNSTMTNHTRYAVDLMVEDSSYYFSNFLLSWISVLDSLGAWEWNLRFFSIAWFLFFAAIRLIFGKKLGVEWYAVIHALITGVGGVVCAYLYHVMAEKLIGTPEPLHTVMCGGALTSLHRVLPTAALGYSIHDLIDGISLGADFLSHGVVLFFFALYMCENEKNEILAIMLALEVSTIFLNFFRAEFFTPTLSTINLILFVVSFFCCRILFGPWSTWEHVKILYNEGMSEEAQHCTPKGFRHVILLSGIFFTVLNCFWFVKVMQKVHRKITGKSKSKLYPKKEI